MGLGVALLSEVSPPARVAPFIAMVTTPSHRTQSIIIMPLDLVNQATPQVEVRRHAPLSHTPYLCSPISVYLATPISSSPWQSTVSYSISVAKSTSTLSVPGGKFYVTQIYDDLLGNPVSNVGSNCCASASLSHVHVHLSTHICIPSPTLTIHTPHSPHQPPSPHLTSSHVSSPLSLVTYYPHNPHLHTLNHILTHTVPHHPLHTHPRLSPHPPITLTHLHRVPR